MTAPVKIVQHNVNRQRIASLQLKDYCIESSGDVVLVQEPVTRNKQIYGFENYKQIVHGEAAGAAIIILNNNLQVMELTEMSGQHIIVIKISRGRDSEAITVVNLENYRRAMSYNRRLSGFESLASTPTEDQTAIEEEARTARLNILREAERIRETRNATEKTKKDSGLNLSLSFRAPKADKTTVKEDKNKQWELSRSMKGSLPDLSCIIPEGPTQETVKTYNIPMRMNKHDNPALRLLEDKQRKLAKLHQIFKEKQALGKIYEDERFERLRKEMEYTTDPDVYADMMIRMYPDLEGTDYDYVQLRKQGKCEMITEIADKVINIYPSLPSDDYDYVDTKIGKIQTDDDYDETSQWSGEKVLFKGYDHEDPYQASTRANTPRRENTSPPLPVRIKIPLMRTTSIDSSTSSSSSSGTPTPFSPNMIDLGEEQQAQWDLLHPRQRRG